MAANAVITATAITAATAAVATTAGPRQQPPLFLDCSSDFGYITDALVCNARLKGTQA
jgi:hypothetical protein